jgi:hypothetical protein
VTGASSAAAGSGVQVVHKRASNRPPSSYQFRFEEPLLAGLHVSPEGVVEMELRHVEVESTPQAVLHCMMLSARMPATGRPRTDQQWLNLLQTTANELQRRRILSYSQMAWLAPLDEDAERITLALQVRPGIKAFYIVVNSPQMQQVGWQASAYTAWLLDQLWPPNAKAAPPRFCKNILCETRRQRRRAGSTSFARASAALHVVQTQSTPSSLRRLLSDAPASGKVAYVSPLHLLRHLLDASSRRRKACPATAMSGLCRFPKKGTALVPSLADVIFPCSIELAS